MTKKMVVFMSALAFASAMAAPLPRDGGSHQISLDGAWQFAVDSTGAFDARSVGGRAVWRGALVPLSWQIQFADLRDYRGVAWYRKTFDAVPFQRSETLILCFGAVDYIAEVFVNGVRVGSHEGGYTPFEFDIGGAVRTGTNEILVRVLDPADSAVISYREIPHGKQSWYVQTSGMWQSVQVRVVPKRRVTDIHVTAARDGGVACEVWMSTFAKGKRPERLSVRILDPQMREIAAASRPVDGMSDTVRLTLHVGNPLLWSPSSPNLYHAEVTLEGCAPVEDRFGFRSFEATNGQLLLNGSPFYLIGALDQDFYPATGYTTPSEEYIRDEMTKAKRMGLNTLRCHIKVPDPRYLKVADEVGILLWCEIPNWDRYTPEAGRRAEETLEAMLARDWNHPSLVIISLINESWGVDLQKEPQRAWLKSAFARAKEKAPGRLVVDNSACWGNFHLMTDINDYHTYWALPENRRRFDRAVDDFAARPPWLFSPFGDAAQTGSEPLVLSEFGNWGLPKISDPEPWWMQRAFGNAHVVLPAAHHERFTEFGYGRVFGDESLLLAESQRAQARALKYEIEKIRMTPQVQGYVITEFTDVHWESNGLLDMWRRPKVAAGDLEAVQQQDVIIVRPVKFNHWADEEVSVDLRYSHFSGTSPTGASVEWSSTTGERGKLVLPAIERGTVRTLPPLRLRPSHASSPIKVRVIVQCRLKDGRVIAKNSCDLFVYPRPPAGEMFRSLVYDPSNHLGAVRSLLRLESSGVRPAGDEPASIISTQLDSLVVASLVRGETVCCLVDSATRFPANFPLTIIRRDSGWYDGNWASSLNWVRRDRPPFSDLNFGPCMGFETDGIGLPMAIGGLKPEDFSDVLAGMFVGWLHLNSGYVVDMKAGTGRLVLCALPLAGHCADDPYAATLLRAIVRMCETPRAGQSLYWQP